MSRGQKVRTIESLVALYKHPPVKVVLEFAKALNVELTDIELCIITKK